MLPKTNCKACGDATCFNFAIKLAAGQARLEQCAPLYGESELASQKDHPEALVKTKWPTM